jgi:hypothetical protein
MRFCVLLLVSWMLSWAPVLAEEEKQAKGQQTEAEAPQLRPETDRASAPKPRPVKPFVPTEKISADGTVAFPVDI